MKKVLTLYILTLYALFCACSSSHEGWVGTFTNEFGTTYELHPDSTCTITFDDGVEYISNWVERNEEGLNYVNIEFAGNDNYYYLKNNKIYRTKQGMMQDSGGNKIKYQK